MPSRWFGLVVVVASGVTACGAPADDGAEEAQAQSGAWARAELARRPGFDDVDYESVSLAIDRQGGRHLAFVAEDGFVHYRAPSGAEKVFDELAAEAARPRLALGPDGEPQVAFTSDPYSFTGSPIVHAARAGGAWRVAEIGRTGEVDAIAVDDAGAVHVASNDVAPSPTRWRALVSTRAPGGAWVHAEVPRPPTIVSGMSSFHAFALAVDRAGAESLLLATSPVELGTGVLPATHFARRAAGGAFRVESVDVAASAGALVRDDSGTLHAVVSSRGFSGTHPLYLRRGPSDAAWSAPESISLRTSYYSSIAIDARGAVHVAFSTNHADALVHATRSASGRWTEDAVFDGHAQLPSLALDPSGAPVIAYRSGASYWLTSARP